MKVEELKDPQMAFHYVCLIEEDLDDPHKETYYVQIHKRNCQDTYCKCKYDDSPENHSAVT